MAMPGTPGGGDRPENEQRKLPRKISPPQLSPEAYVRLECLRLIAALRPAALRYPSPEEVIRDAREFTAFVLATKEEG